VACWPRVHAASKHVFCPCCVMLCLSPHPQQAMLPANLDQYSRSCLQGYTGYRPQGGTAASAVIPAKGPTAETTTGMVNQQVREGGWGEGVDIPVPPFVSHVQAAVLRPPAAY
jgi:hypothetical protein